MVVTIVPLDLESRVFTHDPFEGARGRLDGSTLRLLEFHPISLPERHESESAPVAATPLAE